MFQYLSQAYSCRLVCHAIIDTTMLLLSKTNAVCCGSQLYMTLLPYAVLLYIPLVYASLLNLNGTSATTFNVSDSPPSCGTRTLWSVIWSCAATLFACTWTAIHPNIPGMDEGKLIVLCRRLRIMIMALVAPDLMITWAANYDNPDIGESAATLLSEIRLSDGRNNWTVTQGFFTWMGGLLLYFDDKSRATLRPDELLRFVREGSVDVPVIIEADIKDRSKGDALSKGIAILQLAWFVLQLVARNAQNLLITLLEIDTLAVAALTSITYGFWWKKPKDVGRPHAIYWKATTSLPKKLAYKYVI
ncbi:hypothetical protein EDD22DRAFT_806031, partial [Suillus occidentalis]